MKKLMDFKRIPAKFIDRNIFICDLISFEGAILSLFRRDNHNWLYLWCDTDKANKNRWLLFPVSRSALVGYLDGQRSLRELVVGSKKYLVLDQSATVEQGDDKPTIHRYLKEISSVDQIAEYLPSDDSYFESELSPDISLANEINPTRYDVPIDGEWFFADLDRFSRLYGQLYSFFYCTKPRFVTNLGSRIERNLRSPWKGGYSRVNLFDALSRLVPSLHDLEIKKMQYASPGEISIEALKSVGDGIAIAVLRYIEHEKSLVDSEKAINTVLSASKLRRVDLSQLNDKQLPLDAANIEVLKQSQETIAGFLGIASELKNLSSFSPNIAVTSKVFLSLLVRIRRLAEFQTSGQIDFDRNAIDSVQKLDA
ncbi:MAG: hypothetical protein ACOYBW_10575 [Fluviibacter phosphoraccumulans]